jgi:transposase-like protein
LIPRFWCVSGRRTNFRINLDGNAASHRALRLLRKQEPRWRSVIVRSRRYLNNIVEQDHRAIKRRCAPMLGTSHPQTTVLDYRR